MSRKRWSDLFLAGAAISVVLAVVLGNYGRMLSIFLASCFLIAGMTARRRMLHNRRSGREWYG
jgi:hypothetical protein